MIAETIASVIVSPRAARREKLVARDWMLELLARPFSAAEVAEKLGVSKPTAIKWLRAGLLRRAENTSEREHKFDVASVLSTREVLTSLKMTGTVAERARLLAGLPERLFWSANPQALADLERSLHEANANKLTTVSDAELERGRQLLAARRARSRRGSRARRSRKTAARTR